MAVTQPIEFYAVKDKRELSATRRWASRVVAGAVALRALGQMGTLNPATGYLTLLAYLIALFFLLWLLSDPVDSAGQDSEPQPDDSVSLNQYDN